MRVLVCDQGGAVSIFIPVPQPGKTFEQIVAQLVPANAQRLETTMDKLPPRDDLMPAWMIGPSADDPVVHNMTKAKAIWKDRMRAARTPLLEALDSESLMSLEKEDKQAQKDVADKKQALRDVTDDPAIEAAVTITELKAVWPLCLGVPST